MLHETLELDIVRWFQGLGDWLETPLTLFTYLGYPVVYILLVPVLYWAVDVRLAARVAVFLFAGGIINDTAKLVARSPRPFWVDPGIRTFGDASGGFGMPSGHSQVAAPAWGLVVARRYRWATAVGVAVAVLIAVSRVYLGVHSPSQVLIGLALGGALLWLMVRYDEPVVRWFLGFSLTRQLLLIAGLVATGCLAGLLASAAADSWQVPEVWSANFAAAAGADETLDPVRSTGVGLSAGSLGGTLVGLTLQHHLVGWRCTGGIGARLIRIPVGAIAMSIPAAIVSASFAVAGIDTEVGTGEESFGFALTFALFFGVFFLAPAVFARIQPQAPPADDGRRGQALAQS